jgi:hypothetical protein
MSPALGSGPPDFGHFGQFKRDYVIKPRELWELAEPVLRFFAMFGGTGGIATRPAPEATLRLP